MKGKPYYDELGFHQVIATLGGYDSKAVACARHRHGGPG